MYAMQYEINLPADYDMKIIRQRVATNGHKLDDFPGLGLKAYLIRERGQEDSLVNQYAPFYFWSSIEGMNKFLWGGGGFVNIINAFGRPTVRHWTGVEVKPGPAFDTKPTRATKRSEKISSDEDLAAAVEHAHQEVSRLSKIPGVHSTGLAIDPHHWELIHFTLWQNQPVEKTGTGYEVLHVSKPQFAEMIE